MSATPNPEQESGTEPRGDPASEQAAAPADGGDSADERRLLRQRQILESAKLVFAANGYHDASINDIISRANIARGTFYLYFSNKHKVFDAILDEALRELRARITRIKVGSAEDAPQQQLRQNLVRVLTYLLDDQPLTQLLLSHSQQLQSEVAERVDAFFADVTKMVVASLSYGIAANMVRPCDTRVVAAALIGAVRGVVSESIKADAEVDIEALADEFLAFAMYGVFRA